MKDNKHLLIKFIISINNCFKKRLIVSFFINFVILIILIFVALFLYHSFKRNTIINTIPYISPINYSVYFLFVTSIYSFVKEYISVKINHFINSRRAYIFTQIGVDLKDVKRIKDYGEYRCLDLSNSSEENFDKNKNSIYVLIKVKGHIYTDDQYKSLYLKVPSFAQALTRETINGKDKIKDADNKQRLFLQMPKSGTRIIRIIFSSVPNGFSNNIKSSLVYNGPSYIKPIYLDKIRLKLKGES